MVTRFFILFVFVLSAYTGAAQPDSVLLEEIVIQSDHFQRFSTGSNFKKIEINTQDRSLEEVVQGQPGVFFKTYGNGQLASISFRGTGAQHTNVLWHGIPSNYPTLGQMDFSQWPTWMMESVSISPGGDGALYGSSAIGGSILIDSDIESVLANSAEMTVGTGSFGYRFAGGRLSWTKDKFNFKTKVFWSDLDNDFSYEYQGQQYTQQNARVENSGLDQIISYELSNGEIIYLHGQYSENDRGIQPGMASPNNENHLLTKNGRLALGYQKELEKGSFTSTLALLMNDQLYNETDQTISKQCSGVVIYSGEISKTLSYRIGGNYNVFRAKADAYGVEPSDQQTDLFTSLGYKPSNFWEINLNLRQSFYDGLRPFTPSLGQQIRVLKTDATSIRLKAKGSLGFRYPTLNDRYWAPGGNPDLSPEKSRTLEGGLVVNATQNDYSVEWSADAYKTWSDDWIVWLPAQGAIWSPTNFRAVEITGVDISSSIKSHFLEEEEFNVSFSLVQAQNMTGGSTEKQLPYTPRHLVSGFYQMKILATEFRMMGQYTGRRFVTLDNEIAQSVDPYFLLNCSASKKITVFDLEWTITGAIRNLLDNSYQNLSNIAMPGRNFELKLTIKTITK